VRTDNRNGRYATVVLTVVLVAAGASAQAQPVAPVAPDGKPPVQIISRGAGDVRTLIAVPPCAAPPGQESLAIEVARIISYDLAFTGLFIVAPPDKYPPKFTGFTQDPTQIDFAAWQATGIESLVYAFVTMNGDELTAECRLFDMSGQQMLGKRFTAKSREWFRLVPHQFSEEIVRSLTGTPGIATSEICFSSGATGKKEICIADYDGANFRQITKHGSISILPTFSPNGAKIAYLSFKDRFPFLYVYDRATGKSTAISKNAGLNVSPAWSPDGNSIAMTLSKDANEEIYLANADGSNPRRLTNNKELDTSPTFSPDGNQIAFVSERGGSAQIYAMDVSGGNARRLSYQGGRAYDPAWSPDGSKIAYVAERSGEGFEIYVLDVADSKNYKRLTDSGGSNESPSWSADSRHIIFASSRSSGWSLWTVNVESGEEYPVPNLKSSCQGPSWGPRRQ
jgi:TolB protein